MAAVPFRKHKEGNQSKCLHFPNFVSSGHNVKVKRCVQNSLNKKLAGS